MMRKLKCLIQLPLYVSYSNLLNVVISVAPMDGMIVIRGRSQRHLYARISEKATFLSTDMDPVSLSMSSITSLVCDIDDKSLWIRLCRGSKFLKI